MRIKKTADGWHISADTKEEENRLKWLMEDVFQASHAHLGCDDQSED